MMLRRTFPLTLASAGEEGIIEGYGSVFGVRDSYGDIVQRGAFVASLAAHKAAGTMPAMLWQHNPEDPIGVWTDMAEDDRGLRVRGRITMESDLCRDKYHRLKAGGLRGLSIGFMISEGGAHRDRESGIRTVTAVDLWEVSVVTFAANPAATAAVKSADIDGITKPSEAERMLREVAPELSKKDATAFVSRLMRMGAERREAEIVTERANRVAERLARSLANT